MRCMSDNQCLQAVDFESIRGRPLREQMIVFRHLADGVLLRLQQCLQTGILMPAATGMFSRLGRGCSDITTERAVHRTVSSTACSWLNPDRKRVPVYLYRLALFIASESPGIQSYCNQAPR